jgi:hypothetical protein
MIGRVLAIATVLAATPCLAHAAPLQLGDTDLDQISAGRNGNGNGNGNVGNNNGNHNQGSNNGNGNASSGNGNGNSTDNNGNGPGGSGASEPAPEDVLNVKDVLHDVLTDIIAFDDGSRAGDLRREVKLRIYKARLAMAKAKDDGVKARKLERKIDRFAAKYADAAAAAERKRRNGITRDDLGFVFSSGDDAPNPKKGLQRIVDRGFVLYGSNAAQFDEFADRLRSVVHD